MTSEPAGRLATMTRSLAHKRAVAGRYLVVSVINVINHQGLLLLANAGWGWSGGLANVFAACVAAVPAYLLSRYWVWEVRGRHSLRTEIIPFWTIALLGLLVSTAFAEAADRTLGAGLWVAAASFTAYFLVWILKFLVLDGLFVRPAEPERARTPVA